MALTGPSAVRHNQTHLLQRGMRAELLRMLNRLSARLRRASVKSQLVLRHLSRTRSARAAAQFCEAIRADITDVASCPAERYLVFLRSDGNGRRAASALYW